MKKKFILSHLFFFLCLVLIHPRYIQQKNVSCPGCKTLNIFQTNIEFNHDPFSGKTRYHYFSEDYTQNHIIYCCIKCHLSAFFWDFNKIPYNQASIISRKIKSLTMDLHFVDYQAVPFMTRMLIAEKVYQHLEKDNEFWCLFYRLAAWHHEQSGDLINAVEYRKKSLDKVRTMIKDSSYQGRLKELLSISGILHFFIGEPQKALQDFRSAKMFRYYVPGNSPSSSRRKENRLDILIRDFIIKITGDRI